MSLGRAACLLGAVAPAVLLAASARAEVALRTTVQPAKVEVGSRFRLQLSANAGDGEQLGTPTLKLPPEVTGSGPSVGQQSQISIVNGRMTQSLGITATWILVASKPGKYKLGPVSVPTGSGVVSDRPVMVEVVPPGSLPPPPLAGQPFDPFGMFGGLGGPGFPNFPGFPGDMEQQQQQLPELPEEYKVDHPLDKIAFLRSRAVPKRVVVGEQVTLSVYAYGGRGAFGAGTANEPSRNDFLAFNLMEDAGEPTKYLFEQDGQRWITCKVSEFALFPLKTGRLKAGEMTFGFTGPGYSSALQGLPRTSQPITIHVVEPPLDGRPPGYRLGDVGNYTLSAQVEPREVPAGGSISIVAKLKGVGNLPFALLLPERDGVHFLEPTLVEQVAPQRGVVQGFRTFTYVVELSQPGEQDLGEITLPYWDPKAKQYGVARAVLGTVKVTGTAKPAAAANAKSGAPGSSAARLKGLVTPPTQLGTLHEGTASYWPAKPGFWLLLLGLPLSAVLGFGLSDLLRSLRARASARRGSLATALDDALAQLATAVSSGNATATATAAERALFLAIEKNTGIKGRGILKSALARTLTDANVPAEDAERAARLLGHCDELRFAGEAVDLSTFGAEARELCKKLGRP